MTPAEWYSSAEFARVHQELAAQRAVRERARLAARTPEQIARDRHEAAWDLHLTCGKTGERGCDPTKDGHLCRPSGSRPGPLHGERDPLWRDELIGRGS